MLDHLDDLTEWDFAFACIIKGMISSGITLWLNVYDTNREYGGPEEGGWYYDIADPILHKDFPALISKITANTAEPECIYDLHPTLLGVRFNIWYGGRFCPARNRVYDSSGRVQSERLGHDIRQAHDILKEFIELENKGRYPVGSVLNDGIYELRLEMHEPQQDPLAKPHYE